MYQFVMKRAKRRLFAKREQFYFVLVASNNQVVMTSETYYNRDDIRTVIGAMRRGIMGAVIVDDTNA
jgi:uncharacterized protein YegP (UPF0339 family)